MDKILTIARREYQAMVATKAFLIGMTMMPILMMGGMWLPGLLQKLQKSEERNIAVVDHSGQLFDSLQTVAEERNRRLKESLQKEQDQDATDGQTAPVSASRESEQQKTRRSMGFDDINYYVLSSIPSEGFGDDRRLELSEQIRQGKLAAFVEIPADILTNSPGVLTSPEALQLPDISYCSQDAALSDARSWLREAINTLIKARRMEQSGVSPVVLLELNRRADVVAQGLYERNAAGEIVSKAKPNELASIFLPMGIMMLMFMIIMMSAQPMLESVLEEKTQRISEVLLGSANARQLMTGKLLGNVTGSMTIFALYAGGGFVVANLNGYGDSIPYHILPWFIVYQILAVLMFSSVFLAIGSSVSQLREAQSLLLPVWMVILLPLMVWFNVVRDPNSMMATGLSFFPPSAPMMMILRLATGATIPLWQIPVSILIVLAGTAVGVLAASRIYRVGILWQGKTPRLSEMIAWLFRDPTAARQT